MQVQQRMMANIAKYPQKYLDRMSKKELTFAEFEKERLAYLRQRRSLYMSGHRKSSSGRKSSSARKSSNGGKSPAGRKHSKVQYVNFVNITAPRTMTGYYEIAWKQARQSCVRTLITAAQGHWRYQQLNQTHTNQWQPLIHSSPIERGMRSKKTHRLLPALTHHYDTKTTH